MVATATYTVIALITGKSLRSTASITSRPMPGMEKKRSIRKAPMSNPGSCAMTWVMIGIDALRSTCTHMMRFSDRPLARGAHVLLIDLVEHKGAEQPQVGRDADDEPDQNGKRRVDDEVLPEAVAPALHREPAKLVGKEILKDDDVNQDRYRQADGADDHHRAVGQRASYVRDTQREADRDDGADDQQRDQHRQRRAEPCRHDVRDRLVGAPARAEVGGEHLPDENAQLHVPGLIDAE